MNQLFWNTVGKNCLTVVIVSGRKPIAMMTTYQSTETMKTVVTMEMTLFAFTLLLSSKNQEEMTRNSTSPTSPSPLRSPATRKEGFAVGER